MKNVRPVKVMATIGSSQLAAEVSTVLATKLPLDFQPADGIFTPVQFDYFDNDNVEAKVDNVRGHRVIIVHTMTPPVDIETMRLFALINAIRDAKADDLLLVFTYMTHSRSDRKNKARISTMGCLFPKLIDRAGANKVILLDPHDSHLKHYFEPAADEISAIFLIIDYLQHHFFTTHPKDQSMLVFPDQGSLKRFENAAWLLDLPMAYINKYRPDNSGEVIIRGIVGNVQGQHCIILDDESLSGGTLIKDAKAILTANAASVTAAAIHPVLRKANMTDDDLVKKLIDSPIERFIFTDSIPVTHKLPTGNKFTVLPVAGLLAEAISRDVQDNSLTALFSLDTVPLYQMDPIIS